MQGNLSKITAVCNVSENTALPHVEHYQKAFDCFQSSSSL